MCNYHPYYIYYATHKDVIVYIGKGSKDRYKHCTSGKSHNFEMNEIYFQHLHFKAEPIEVNILKGFYDEEEAYEFELMLINEFKPKFNSDLKCDKSLEINCILIESHRGDYIEFKSKRKSYGNMTISERIKNNKPISFTSIAKEYHKIMTKMSSLQIGSNDYNELNLQSNELLNMDDDLRKYVETLGWQKLSTMTFARAKLENEYQEKHTFIDKKQEILEFMSLDIGKTYDRESIVLKLTHLFQFLDISLKPKISEITKIYEINNTTIWKDKKTQQAIKIIGIK